MKGTFFIDQGNEDVALHATRVAKNSTCRFNKCQVKARD